MLTFLPEWRGLSPETLTFRLSEDAIKSYSSSKMRGEVTLLPMPHEWLYPVEGEFVWAPHEYKETFYDWCKVEDVWTLAFSPDTYIAAMALSMEWPDIWDKVKAEIFPSQANEHAHRKHGTAGTYGNWGCHAPLCAAANREKSRKRIDAKSNPVYTELDKWLLQVSKSHEAYLTYIKYVRNFRLLQDTRPRSDPFHWAHVDFRTTLLMECTNY